MRNLALAATAALMTLPLALPTTASALSFLPPSNYETNAKCAKAFDRYVSLVSHAWNLQNEQILGGVDHSHKIERLNRRAARVQRRVDRHCEY